MMYHNNYKFDNDCGMLIYIFTIIFVLFCSFHLSPIWSPTTASYLSASLTSVLNKITPKYKHSKYILTSNHSYLHISAVIQFYVSKIVADVSTTILVVLL